MKTFLLLAAVALCASLSHQSTAQERPAPFPADNRLVSFVYSNSETFTVLTRPQSATHVVLASDETLEHVVLGDTVQWITAKLPNHFFIKPIKPDIFTSATILTSKRTYQLTFRSGAPNGKWMQRVSWNYPEEDMMTSLKIEKESQDRRYAKADESTLPSVGSPTPESLNWGYTISGDAPFRPVAVFDDGKFVYVRLPGNSQEHPAIFSKDADNALNLVNYVTKGDLIVIQKLTPRLVMRLGKDEITVVRDAPRNAASGKSLPSALNPLNWFGR